MKIKKEIVFLKNVIDKSGMFLITDVYQYYIFFLGYKIGNHKKEKELDLFFDEFTEFTQKTFDFGLGMPWYKIIQLYSSTNYQSLELLRDVFGEFLKSCEDKLK